MNNTKQYTKTDFSRCDYCGREFGFEEITVVGLDSQGLLKHTSNCCINNLALVLSAGVPMDATDSHFNKTISLLKTKGVDTTTIEKIHKGARPPYAQHIFVGAFEELNQRGTSNDQ